MSGGFRCPKVHEAAIGARVAAYHDHEVRFEAKRGIGGLPCGGRDMRQRNRMPPTLLHP